MHFQDEEVMAINIRDYPAAESDCRAANNAQMGRLCNSVLVPSPPHPSSFCSITSVRCCPTARRVSIIKTHLHLFLGGEEERGVLMKGSFDCKSHLKKPECASSTSSQSGRSLTGLVRRLFQNVGWMEEIKDI